MAEEPEDNGASSAAAGLIAAAGVAGLAAWGLSKLFGSSSSSQQAVDYERTMEPPPQRGWQLPTSNDCHIMSYDHHYNPSRVILEDKGTPPQDRVWKKPQKGWFKLNTDASFFNQGKAVGGGLIRDDAGGWIVGFTVRLPSCSNPTSAEMHALRHGLKLAWDQGLRKVEVETDCEQAINHIENLDQIKTSQELRNIALECRGLLQDPMWKTIFNHVVEDGNRCADALAVTDLLRNHPDGAVIWYDPPLEKIKNRVKAEMDNK